ncbi:MAG TPA: helix-turn-helix domain-containing protein [Pseudolysinimonas sp.]|nr:helix-turn-helix domain-containing protein [Pseudolysinimonas sp.]
MTAAGDEEWFEVIARSFYPLTITGISEEFTATVRQTSLTRGVRVAEVMTDPNALRRTWRQTRQSPSNDVLLLIQLTGTAYLQQDDRRVELSSGQATLCDPVVEYEVATPDKAHQLVLMLPRDVVRHLAAPIASTRLQVLTPKMASLRALTALVQETVSEVNDLDAHESDALAGVILDLTRSMFARATGSVNVHSSREALAATALAYIHNHAGDGTLSAERVANATGVTTAQLATLLRPQGTLAHILRQARLRAARSRLIDLQYSEYSVAEIAVMSGFHDQTTFTRAFKREFADLPSELRRLPRS